RVRLAVGSVRRDRGNGDAASRPSRDRARAGGWRIGQRADAERSGSRGDRNRSLRGGALTVEDTRLLWGLWGNKAEVPIRCRRRDSASRRSCQESLLHEKRLVHFLERARILADG